jgi:hypothetical protein
MSIEFVRGEKRNLTPKTLPILVNQWIKGKRKKNYLFVMRFNDKNLRALDIFHPRTMKSAGSAEKIVSAIFLAVGFTLLLF